PLGKPDNVEADDWVTLDQIAVFDVNSLFTTNGSDTRGWYLQNATGDIPDPRRQFCNVLVSATDNSSHNIYLYGGSMGPRDYRFYDDVYVLSLPSFTWTKIYGPGASPRYGHTCHAVGNRQMISVGGAPSWGFDGPCDSVPNGISVFDLSTSTWGLSYTVDDEPYHVASKVIDTIGGSESGGATMKQPVAGFADPKLSRIFGVEPAPSSSSSRHAGAIAGGVVGGVAALGFLASFFLWRRRRAHRREKDELERLDASLQEKRVSDRPPEVDGAVIEEMDHTPYNPTELSGNNGSYYDAELPGDGLVKQPKADVVVHHELPTDAVSKRSV
ncbi:hypothetical protein LTS18_009772, partial [Coniosporium uncinatum]